MTSLIDNPKVEISGIRKAAMFLMGIGQEISAEVIRQLNPDEIKRIGSEILSLDAVPPSQMLHVFKEFEVLAGTSRYFAQGGPDCARRLLERAIGAESAQVLLDLSEPVPVSPPSGSAEPTSPLHNTDPQELARVLREENPQTLALILSNLTPAQAGPLMSSLPAEVQPQVAIRIALMDRLSPEVFGRIATAIAKKLKASSQLNRANGARSLASILNHVDGRIAENVLSFIETENTSAAANVRDLMFVFEDVVSIDKEGIKALIARVDRKVLTVALKGTGDNVQKHFTQCMSQRSAEMLTEDMEALGPVRIRDVTGAQQQVIMVIRQLQTEGVISVGGSAGGGGDEYVV